MATQQQGLTLPGGINVQELQKKYDTWLKAQNPAVECVITGLTASLQGVFIGYLLGSMSGMDPGPDANGTPSPMKALQAQGGPWVQARNLGVLTGVQAALSLAIKKARNGKEDIWGAMGASFGSGIAYSIASGLANPPQAALTTGFAFALCNGAFYQLGKMFAPQPEHESDYERGKFMLFNLGMPKYYDKLKKGLLTDSTIMLWNDSALKEVGIPPGPRLLILHHLDTYRNPSNVLKPALAPPPMPPRPVPAPPAMPASVPAVPQQQLQQRARS